LYNRGVFGNAARQGVFKEVKADLKKVADLDLIAIPGSD